MKRDHGTLLAIGTVAALAALGARRARGSRSVVTDQGFHRTAITRKQPSRPIQLWEEAGMVQTPALDFGSGRGADCAIDTVDCHDPHHPDAGVRRLPKGKYRTVLLTYVLNVIPKKERHAALRSAASKVKPGGALLVAVRSQSDGGFDAARSGWEKSGDGFIQRSSDGAVSRFQRFYTPAELDRELGAVLGSGWTRMDSPTAPSGSALSSWKRG
jgi:threonine dehydrogenase-like Zn-dependent dehydrogenase